MDENNILNEQMDEQHQLPEEIFATTNEPKLLFELCKNDTIFAVCALVAGVFLSVFGIFGGFALGYLMSALLVVVMLVVYLLKRENISVFSLVCTVFALANLSVFVTTSNGSVRFFAVVVSFLCTLVGVDGFANGKKMGNRDTLGAFYSALATMCNIGVSMKSIFSKPDGDKKSVGKVMVGLLCAVPVLIVVVPLLLSSDDAFSGMMSSILNRSGNGFLTVLKVVFGALLSIFIISYGFSLKYSRLSKVKESKFEGIDNIYIISFLSSISLCYLLYLFSQLAYFFSAFKGFLPNGEITYSQYARKGFFEMCVIAVINLGIVFLSIILAKKQSGKVCVGIKISTMFISAFTLIIIATAISKMVLYINAYGMTVLRITTSSFMLFLAVTFMAVILRIYLSNVNIIKTTVVTACIIVLLLGTVNVNAVCARYNYNAYKSGKLDSIDVEAMYNLGDEGVPYLTKLACSKNKEVASKAQDFLVSIYMEDYFVNMHFAKGFDAKQLQKHQRYTGFSYFSAPKNRAYNTLYKFIENNPKFSTYCLNRYDELSSDFYIHDMW